MSVTTLPPAAANADPITSHQAAAAIEPGRKGQAGEVAGELARHGGADGITSAELALASGLDRYLVARRLPDAEKLGLVTRHAPRPCAVSGRNAVVWRAVLT